MSVNSASSLLPAIFQRVPLAHNSGRVLCVLIHPPLTPIYVCVRAVERKERVRARACLFVIYMCLCAVRVIRLPGVSSQVDVSRSTVNSKVAANIKWRRIGEGCPGLVGGYRSLGERIHVQRGGGGGGVRVVRISLSRETTFMVY